MSLSTTTISNLSLPEQLVGTSHEFKRGRVRAQTSRVQFTPAFKGPVLGLCISQSRRSVGRVNAVCYASYTRCAAAETQTLTRKSSASIVAPPGKEALPMLDDNGGSGFRGIGYTPYYRGDGRGGSGGGGGGFSASGAFPWGDYWFYIFLFLLRFLIMNMIGEGSCVYKYEDGRNKPIRRYV
ncbi:hypothetical protein FRX31_029200 [Thalictrum thalictroides]|uniref:Uncharacterized protein n=1 Tax=Thalictrum thalictroides TaxID=46969 RepID=A0A7J6V9D3_THATH|nr:hypothetical protein FRX31_029200 [Thalictrum thalictroides]